MHHVSNVKMFIVLKCIISLYYDIQIYTKIYPPSPLLFDYNNIIFWTFWNLWVYRYYFISYVSIKQLIQISQLISNGAHVTSYSHNESILLIRIWILIAGGKVLSILSSLDVSSFTSLQYIGLPPRGFLWLNCMGCFTEIIFLFFFVRIQCLEAFTRLHVSLFCLWSFHSLLKFLYDSILENVKPRSNARYRYTYSTTALY